MNEEQKETSASWIGFSNLSQEHTQALINTPFPYDVFKQLAKEGVVTQKNKMALPDGGEMYDLVFPKQYEEMALHMMLTIWKESFSGFPATVSADGEGESIVIHAQFMGPNPVKKG